MNINQNTSQTLEQLRMRSSTDPLIIDHSHEPKNTFILQPIAYYMNLMTYVLYASR